MVKLTSVFITLVAAVGPAYAAATSSGNVWWYTCGNCKCDASGGRTGIVGSTGCMEINDSIRALGLTRAGSLGTTCSVFSDNNCQHQVQSVGVSSGTWGCTALNENAGSIKCYYAA